MDIQFKEIKLDAGWLMLRPTQDSMGQAMACVRKHKDKLYDCEIKEHRNKRSLDANAYMWELIGKLATVMRLPRNEVYRGYIRDLGGNYSTGCFMEKDVERVKRSWQSNGIGWLVDDLGPSQIPGCRNLMLYHGSSTYDSATMARLIDNVVQDCKAVGIETLPPEKLALLKEEWN